MKVVITEFGSDGISPKPSVASATLPLSSIQENVWHEWFSLMEEVKLTFSEVDNAKTEWQH
jgi:hypothetical protein